MCGVGVGNIMKGSFTRPLRVTRIINPGAPHVYIQSGLHAREWIAQVSVWLFVWQGRAKKIKVFVSFGSYL